ncbi:MAG: adenosylcobinamide-phosphate synthase CbiB [Thermoplasmatales archaeon]|nr:adenosylcobinamide-phosphate synthase CbiB [Thermoplasmatales archaeon]
MLISGRELWILIILAALIIDFIFEYPNKIHPVAWIGKLLGFFDNHRFSSTHTGEFINGMVSVLVTILIWITLLYFIGYLPILIRMVVEIYILKSTFSIGGLIKSIRGCETDDIETLRRNTSQIVSRDVAGLDKNHLYSAAFESGSENLVDSVVSPLFYLALFGIWGAVIFRIVNTADAMIGYRNDRYKFYGKFAARADDALNFIPSRLFALLVLTGSPRRVYRNLKNYRRLKINGMYSMATMAALFNVKIEKIGYYFVDGESFPNQETLWSLEYAIRLISYSLFFILMAVVYFHGAWWS